MQRTVRKILRAVANYDPDYYDMYEDTNEALFARLYLERIVRHATAVGIVPPATEPGAPVVGGGSDGSAGVGGRPRPRVLDAGCQAGRLAIPLARQGFQLTGVDTSGFALRRARAHARRAGVEVTWLKGDILRVVRDRHEPYDLVVCAEVIYLSPRYREILSVFAGAVRSGGLVCVSHRSKFYYLIQALRQYDLDAAQTVLARGEGPFRDSAYYNWQTESDLRALYRDLGLRWVAAYPIDRFAWLTGVDPARLSDADRQRWLELELDAPEAEATCGRYTLVIAQRATT